MTPSATCAASSRIASTAAAGSATSLIPALVSSPTASAAFSVPLLAAEGAGTAASHADASRLAFSISAFQGFDATENHESLDAFFSGSASFTFAALLGTASGEGRSRSLVRATSCKTVAAHASFANGVAEITVVSSGTLAETTGTSFTLALATGTGSTGTVFSSTGSQSSTRVFLA